MPEPTLEVKGIKESLFSKVYFLILGPMAPIWHPCRGPIYPIVSRKIEDNQVRIPIHDFLQGYKNGLFQHNELMIYSSPVNSPFDKVNLNLNAIEVMYVEP